MKKNELSIRLNGKQVGTLEQTSSGRKIFTYDNDAKSPISVAMPLREEPYDDLQCEVYFGGLLPENEIAKKLIAKKYGIRPNNSFAMLKAIGNDCAGAISCHSMNELAVPQGSVPLTGKIMTQDELYKHIKELPNNPLFMNVEGLRVSLAGVQDKAAVCLIENQIALPEDECPTTHIFKPTSPRFDGVAENEYFVMKVAKRIGLLVCEVELRKVKDITFLLIERYDRRIKNNCIERIHQEDFCQALGVLTPRKYQNEGGPNFKDCFGLLNDSTQPAIDRNRLAAAIIFNYLIGNMDAHGKNFSLLHHSTANNQLAPLYDMICTRTYSSLTAKMAMKIGSKYKADIVLPRHWEQFSKEINYRYPALIDLIEMLGNQIKQAAKEVKEESQAEGVHHPIIDKIIYFIERNIDQTMKRFSGLLI